MKHDNKWLRQQIQKQRDEYLETYPNRGIAEIVADHLNGVLEFLDLQDKELRESIPDRNAKFGSILGVIQQILGEAK